MKLKGFFMAFGRDGSELELHVRSMQTKTLMDAMDEIIEKTCDPDVKKIASEAITRVHKLESKLEE